ncbi:MAG: aminotransferase class III-fold pyridoxal phosphate-dependent enzyme [Desulfobacteraceae bacterium]|jgi:taurine--2-oxoglutarate transaminase|nr:aminotransferase class III-fold pyridoxal phosphate-dependent enzyme [Desulfobacteraceae bacterium]
MTDLSERIKEMAAHTYGTWSRQKAWKAPLLITDAEGIYFYDNTGKRYLDFSSQLMCSNLGHKNKVVIEAIVKQAEKLPYIAPGFITEIQLEAVEALRSVFPEKLSKFFFSTSGTAANEAALKMVRQSKFPSYKVISRYHSYHGATAAGQSFTGDPRRWYAELARTVVDGVVFAPDSYCYRCPFGITYPECNVQCARYVDYMIREEGNVAAMIVEPIVGTNGRMIPPPEYYPILRQICDEHNVLLICDEVMSGWFRTGKIFAIDHWDVLPDILTTAKGASAAYTPVAITASTDKVSNFFEEEVFCHGHTFAYHALAASAIPAAISEHVKLMDSGLPQKASKYLGQKLYELADKHICIGDVRGVGHFWALEIVKNRKTKEPFDTKPDKFSGKSLMTAKISGDAMQNGLYLSSWYDTMVITPPLIITEGQIDEAIAILDKSLEIADKEAVETDVAASRSCEYAS